MTFQFSPEVERMLREGDERRRRKQAAERADFFGQHVEIPDLDLMPDCAICGSYNMEYEEGFYCDGCNVRWDRNGTRGQVESS